MRTLGLVLVGLALLLAGCDRAPAGVPTPSAVPVPASPSPAGTGAGAATAIAQPATATAVAAGGAPATTATPAAPTAAARATSTPSAGPAGPLLTLTAPAEPVTEVPAATRSVSVAGRAQPDAVVSVNGELLIVDPTGAFRVEVPLDEEVTLVEVVASDSTGREVREQRVIVRE